MKVWFINPPNLKGIGYIREGRCMQRVDVWATAWPPLSLATCAAVVKKQGIEVRLNDCVVEKIDIVQLKEKLLSFHPRLMVMSTGTPSIKNDLGIIKHLKSVLPDLKIAIIGIHGTVLPDYCFQTMKDLDFIVRGEPEYTVRDLVFTIRDKKDISNVKGISYLRKGQIIHTSNRIFIENLDKLPYPAWNLIDRNKYLIPFTKRPFLSICPSRGCPYDCTFCVSNLYYGRKPRCRSPMNIVDELEWNKEKFGVNDFLFWSESFSINRNFCMNIAEEILKRNLKIRWVCNSRVDNVDYEMLKRFKKAGCWMISYGIETGNQKVLDSFKKGITIKQSETAIALAKKAGLSVVAHCIFGGPEESKATIQKTITFVKKTGVDFAQFYCTVPFPGSKLYKQAKEHNWINTNDWTKFEQNFSVLDTEKIKAKEIMDLRKKAYLSFYLRGRVLFNVLCNFFPWWKVTVFIRTIKNFVKGCRN